MYEWPVHLGMAWSMRSRRFESRAISKIIAAILLIAVAVAAAIMLYVFAVGMLSLGGSGGHQVTELLVLQSYVWNTNSTQLTGTFRNVGGTKIALDTADVFISGIRVTFVAVTETLSPQQSTDFTITISNPASLVKGVTYTLKVVTATGAIFAYPVVYGGSG